MASRSLGTLTLDLIARIGGFTRGMDAAEREAEKRSRAISNSLNKIKGTAGQLGFSLQSLKSIAISSLGALAVPISVAGLASMLNDARNAIDGFNDLSDATGSSVENISALDKVARDTGTSFESMSSSLVKFNMVLKDADPDKGAGAVLKALNLDIAELKALDPAEAMRQVAVALEGYANSGDKARAIQELFGKSIKEAAPFLKDLAESGQLNAQVTADQAEEVERFNKELFKLSSSAQDASRSLTINVVTAMNLIIERFREGEKASQSFLAGYWGGVRGFYEAVGLLEQKAKGSRSVSGGILDLTNQTDAESARLLRGAAAKPTLVLPPDASKSKKGGKSKAQQEAESAAKAAQSYLENLKKQLQATEDLSVAETVLADIQAGRLKLAGGVTKEQLLDIATQIDMAKEAAEVLKERRQVQIDELATVEKLNEEYQSFVQSAIDSTPTKVLERQRKEMVQLVEEYERGRFGIVGSKEAMELYGETANVVLGNTAEKVKETDDAMKELGMSFASAFEDAIVSGKSLSDVLKGLEQDIIRIITRKLVTEPLANWATTAISTYFSSGAAFANGGVMTGGGPMQLSKYATGGVATTPQVAIFGEGSMNEAFVPLPDGRSIPVKMSGGGSTVNNFNFQVPATVDRRTQEQIAAMAGAAVGRATRRLS